MLLFTILKFKSFLVNNFEYSENAFGDKTTLTGLFIERELVKTSN